MVILYSLLNSINMLNMNNIIFMLEIYISKFISPKWLCSNWFYLLIRHVLDDFSIGDMTLH